MSGIHSGPEYEAWLQRWKDAAELVETDELAALKEGDTNSRWLVWRRRRCF